MTTTTTNTNGSTVGSATFDHRTGATLAGGPASRYHRVVRCDGRSTGRADEQLGERFGGRPNYAARRLGALLVALTSVMAGAWLVGEVAASVAGHPASAAAGDTAGATDEPPTSDTASSTHDIHVARDGDTLWSIADAHRGDVGRDRFVDALVELNGTTTIHIGQAVYLP